MFAAWQNPLAQVAEVFARALQRDAWGRQQVVLACLSKEDATAQELMSIEKRSRFQVLNDIFADFVDTNHYLGVTTKWNSQLGLQFMHLTCTRINR